MIAVEQDVSGLKCENLLHEVVRSSLKTIKTHLFFIFYTLVYFYIPLCRIGQAIIFF